MARTTIIQRFRGDTASDTVLVRDKKLGAIDLTGSTLRLTVNSEKNPSDSTNELYSVNGVLRTQSGADLGKVDFSPTAGQANQNPGTYYYDVEWTDSGGAITTVLKGEYIYKQDISK